MRIRATARDAKQQRVRLTNLVTFFCGNYQFYQTFIVYSAQKIYNFNGLSKSHIGIIIANK